MSTLNPNAMPSNPSKIITASKPSKITTPSNPSKIKVRRRPKIAPIVTNTRQTINDIFEKCLLIVNKEYILPITSNKGKPGLYLEELLGIPHSSECLDCIDGEIKTFPVKLQNGKFVPKETIAITMLSTDELRTTSFLDSKCYKKMKKMLVVPYYRTDDTIKYMTPKIISEECTELYKILESDYIDIQKGYIETDTLSSSTGTLLQNRTKGAKGSTSRAFYLRTAFMKKYIPL